MHQQVDHFWASANVNIYKNSALEVKTMMPQHVYVPGIPGIGEGYDIDLDILGS